MTITRITRPRYARLSPPPAAPTRTAGLWLCSSRICLPGHASSRPHFAESFSDADYVVLTEIFLSREEPLEGVSGAWLAAMTAERRGAEHVTYVADKTMLPARLADMVQPGDVVITLGAGDIRAAGEGLLAL